MQIKLLVKNKNKLMAIMPIWYILCLLASVADIAMALCKFWQLDEELAVVLLAVEQ